MTALLKNIDRYNELFRQNYHSQPCWNYKKTIFTECKETEFIIKKGTQAILPFGKEAPKYSIGDIPDEWNNRYKIIDVQYDNSELFYTVELLQDLKSTNFGAKYTGTALCALDVSCNLQFNSNIFSQTSDVQPEKNCMWYDTANNLVKRVVNNAPTDSILTFPIATVHQNNKEIPFATINYDAIGYIGATIFCKKGVTVNIPYGLDDLGRKVFKKVVTSKIIVFKNQELTAQSYLRYIAIGRYPDGKDDFGIKSWATQIVTTGFIAPDKNGDAQPLWFDKLNNRWKCRLSRYSNGDWLNIDYAIVGYYASDKEENRITDFKIFPSDQNDSLNPLGTDGFPSDNYINLEIGASGSYYTAPANGWFTMRKKASKEDQWCGLYTSMTHIGNTIYSSSAVSAAMIFCPVRKGQKVFLGYSFGGTDDGEFLRFVYAEGEK